MPGFWARGTRDMETAAHVLELAEQTADQAIADAHAEAERIIARAREEAERIIADARARTGDPGPGPAA